MTQAPPLRAFTEEDGDFRHVAGRTIAFIGYGNQGRAQALNLRDSGAERIIVGTASDDTWGQAKADGFEPRNAADAASVGEIIFLLVPDEVLPEVFRDDIAPNLNANNTLVFASGYNLAFAGIQPAVDLDVVLLAPRMIGRQVRQLFERGDGFYCYVSVEQDASGRAWPTLLALAKGIGALRRGAFELSAWDETVIDLYMEQGFGAAYGSLVFQALAVGIDAGISPEALVLELYLSGEMGETVQAMAELGFVEQSRLHSPTSQYGGMTRSLRFDREPLRKHLQQALNEIRSGAFAKEWAEERASNYAKFNEFRSLADKANPFTAIEQRIRTATDDNRA
jgi:ketol-acid reductoisomerase